MNKSIIFDLDGTLLYTLGDINSAINFALKSFNLRENTLEQTREYVGLGSMTLVKKSIYHIKNPVLFINNPISTQVLDLYNKKYREIQLNTTRPYDTVIQTLKSLKDKGYKLAVLSNKPDIDTKTIINHYFEGVFDIVEGDNDNYRLKPNHKHLKDLIYKLGSKVENTIYVGDSITDIKTAHNANVKCISCTYGYVDKEILKLYNKYTIDKFSEILELI